MRNKIAIVVQRYGLEVNGGAEYHARILAEKLSEKNQITILTTTALDYHNWENYYPEGKSEINGIDVLRFRTINMKSRKTRVARRAIHKKKKYFKILKFLGLFNYVDKKLNISDVKNKHIEDWIIGQGPYCPELIQYIEKNKESYNIFIFFTYLYYPTVKGIPLVAEKSIFIPTAHDEPLIYTKPYEKLFDLPKFIMYNTESEKKLIENLFKEHTKYSDVAGVGIDNYRGDEVELPNYAQPKKYFIYIGRIDTAKGCDIMLKYFIEFLKSFPYYADYKLILVGKNYMNKQNNHPSIIYTGFISEELKHSLLKNSLAMIMPSFYESLSLVTLEAMNEKIPVIVNQECDVLYQHILKSDSGSFFNSQLSFSNALIKYINYSSHQLIEEGDKAKKYVQTNYTWTKIIEKFEKAFQFLKAINN